MWEFLKLIPCHILRLHTFYYPWTRQEFCHLPSCDTILSGLENMGWFLSAICYLWRKKKKKSPSGLVSSLIYSPLSFGNTPMFISIWAHLESKPDYTWGYTLCDRNVPSGNKRPLYSLARTAYFFVLHGPSRNFAIYRVVAPCCRAQQIWVDAHLLFAVCGAKKWALVGMVRCRPLFTVHYRLATPLCLCPYEPTSSQNQTILEATHFVAGMCQVEIRGLSTL